MSADKPEISIIVPAYNAGSYLPDCLESIIRQTFSNWELIIADDGSSDDTGNIADAFAANDGRIRVLHLARQGVSEARNSGLDNARGSFIAFVDSDDVLEPDYLKELYSHAIQSGADITQCSFVHVDEKGDTIPDPDANEAVYKDGNDILNAHFRGQQGDIRVSVWAKLFRRDPILNLRFDTGLRVYEDAYYVYLCCKAAKTVCCFKTPLYRYVHHDTSVTHSSLPEIWPDYFIMYERQKSECRDDRIICKNVDRREAETGLWLMRILFLQGDEKEVWTVRKKLLRITWPVIWSSAPSGIKMKLFAVALMPHIYFAMLRKRIASDHEKV